MLATHDHTVRGDPSLRTVRPGPALEKTKIMQRALDILRVGAIGFAVSSVAWGEEPKPDLQDILRRLETAERQVQTLQRHLNKATSDVQQLRDELTRSKTVVPAIPSATTVATQPSPSLKDWSNGDPPLDPAMIKHAEEAFQTSCTECHEASRPLQKQNNLQGWRSTVRRMANKRGADIPTEDWESIASYLASVAGPKAGPVGLRPSSETLDTFLGGHLDLSATITAIWRGSSHEDGTLENRGLVPEIWTEAAWQGNGPLRGLISACYSCHRDDDPGNTGNRVELVEGLRKGTSPVTIS